MASASRSIEAVRRRVRRRPAASGDEGDLVARRLRQLLASHHVDVAIDVGANRGMYSEMLRSRLAFSGRIVSFEPDPDLFDELTSRMGSDRQWTGRCVAAGSERGTSTLNRVPRAPGLNSLLPPSEEGARQFNAFGSVEPVEVAVDRLDACLPPLIGESGNLLVKIDTQGYELEVLRGTGALVDRVAILQIEVPSRKLYSGMASATELLSFLDASGFELVDVVTGGRDRDGVFLLDFDVIAARRFPGDGVPGHNG